MEWSPCGRKMLIATTQPRLRVDNNFKVLNYRGEILQENPLEVLYEAVRSSS
jgi:translation initiation factor 2A